MEPEQVLEVFAIFIYEFGIDTAIYYTQCVGLVCGFNLFKNLTKLASSNSS